MNCLKNVLTSLIRNNLFLVSFLVYHMNATAQDDYKFEHATQPHFQLAMGAGIHYSEIFNAHEIQYEPNACIDLPSNFGCPNDYVSMKQTSTTGLHGGIVINHLLKKFPVFFESGIIIYTWKRIFEGNKDTIIKYSSLINPEYKYWYQETAFQIPLSAGVSLSNFRILSGVYCKFIKFQKTGKIFYDGSELNNYNTFYSKNYTVFLKATYRIKNNKTYLFPYIGINRQSSNEYDFMVGINISLLDKP